MGVVASKDQSLQADERTAALQMKLYHTQRKEELAKLISESI
jgi:hypothetical protein